MAEFTLKKKIEGDIVIIETDGYLNNIGGEKIQSSSTLVENASKVETDIAELTGYALGYSDGKDKK